MCLTYRCGLYIRVSSEEQARWGDSIRDQEVRGREYVAAHRELVLQGIYIDDGVSGQKLQREDFSRLMADVQAGKIQRILFTKLDRWFRSLRHYLNTQAVLEEHGVSWTAIDQPYFDTSTPHGRAFVAQSMMWACLLYTSAESPSSSRAQSHRGLHPGGQTASAAGSSCSMACSSASG